MSFAQIVENAALTQQLLELHEAPSSQTEVVWQTCVQPLAELTQAPLEQIWLSGQSVFTWQPVVQLGWLGSLSQPWPIGQSLAETQPATQLLLPSGFGEQICLTAQSLLVVQVWSA